MSRSVKITRSGAELRGGGRAAAGQIVHMLDAEADVLVDRGEATELNTISQAIMPTPANGDVLTYVTSAGQWENKPASTDPTFASLHVTGTTELGGFVGGGSGNNYVLSSDSFGNLDVYSKSDATTPQDAFVQLIGTSEDTGTPSLYFMGWSTGAFPNPVALAFNKFAFIQWVAATNELVIDGVGNGKHLRVGVDTQIDGKVGFNGASPSQPLLATGAGATVDQVVAALQTLGLVKQS